MMRREEDPLLGELLKTRDAGRFLWGTTAKSNYYRLYRMRDAGVLHPVKVDGTYYFKRRELEQFVSPDDA